MFVSSDGLCRRRLEEMPSSPHQLAVGVDLALGAQVAHEIPMQRGLVDAAEGEVYAEPSATCIVPPIFSSKRVFFVKRSIS